MTATKQDSPLKDATSLKKRVLQGGGFAMFLVVFSITLVGDGEGQSVRSIVLPLLLVPLAGCIGGVVFYITDPMRQERGWWRAAANIVSVMAYCLLLFISYILATNGTS